jgi:hypothetical protein
MKKLILATAAAGLMLSGAAFATDFKGAGNTVRVIVNDAGEGFDVYFDADGSYADSRGMAGATWTYDGAQLCVVPPAEAEAPSTCGPWDATLDVGGSWQTDGWSQDGNMITISILEGRGHDAPTPPTPPAE